MVLTNPKLFIITNLGDNAYRYSKPCKKEIIIVVKSQTLPYPLPLLIR